VAPTIPVAIGPDLERCADQIRAHVALYVGGMGSARENFYNLQVQSIGFESAAAAVQAAYLDGRPRDAAALLPFELLDALALLGPAERIAERLPRYPAAEVTTLNVTPFDRTLPERVATLRTLADLVAQLNARGRS
jgi:hypothetical protein